MFTKRVLILTFLTTFFILDALAQEEYTRKDSLLVSRSRLSPNDADPFFGFSDLDIDGNYAIGGMALDAFPETKEVKLFEYSDQSNLWNLTQTFPSGTDNLLTTSLKPKVALDENTAVFQTTELIPSTSSWYYDYIFLERDEAGTWALTDTLTLFDLPESITSDLILESEFTNFGVNIVLRDDFFVIVGRSTIDNQIVALAYTRINDEWVFTQRIDRPEPFQNNSTGTGLNLFESGELIISSSSTKLVYEFSEGQWILSEAYTDDLFPNNPNFKITEDFIFVQGPSQSIIVYERQLPLPEPMQIVEDAGWKTVSDKYIISYLFNPNPAPPSIVVHAYDESTGWSLIASLEQDYHFQFTGSSFWPISYNSFFYVFDDGFVTVDYNTFSAGQSYWFNIDTECRAPEISSLDLINDESELAVKWFSQEHVVTNQVQYRRPSLLVGSTYPIDGDAAGEFSKPVSILAPGVWQARVRSLCRLEPRQVSGYSDILSYNLMSSGNGLMQLGNSTKNRTETRVFPNPANDFITVQSTADAFTYRIYDLSGKLIDEGVSVGNAKRIQTARYLTGQYFLEITGSLQEVERIPFIVGH